MKKRIVIALGGNALGNTFEEQQKATAITAKTIADLVQNGDEIVVTHGNGPQVGMISLALDIAAKINKAIPSIPLPCSVAMSQAYIGFGLQNAIREEFLSRKMHVPVAAIVTQVVVEKDDKAFMKPTKPIGAFYSAEKAQEMINNGENMMEDAGRGWRRVVASPLPIDIIETESILAALNAGHLPIACGGGGIPVCKENGKLIGVDAVIDKDFASAKLAEIINADYLIILTAVEKISLNFRQANEKTLDTLTVAEAKQFIAEGHFAPGSMLPKVEAAVEFAASKQGRTALVTQLEKAQEALQGKTGTIITL